MAIGRGGNLEKCTGRPIFDIRRVTSCPQVYGKSDREYVSTFGRNVVESRAFVDPSSDLRRLTFGH